MTELELVAQLKSLRQITPSREWAFLLKNRIASEQGKPQLSTLSFFEKKVSLFAESLMFIFQEKALVRVFSFLVVVSVIFGTTLSFARNAVPGDVLYPVKRLTEKTRQALASNSETPKMNFDLANERLNEITKVNSEGANQIADEMTANLSQAAASFDKIKDSKTAAKVAKEIVSATPKLEKNLTENKKKIAKAVTEAEKLVEKANLKAMAVLVLDPQSLSEYEAQIAERLSNSIQKLENQNNSEEANKIIRQAKDNLRVKDYVGALERIEAARNLVEQEKF